MTDIATSFDNDAMSGDLAVDNGLLVSDDSLLTALLHSILSDRRANETDELLPGEAKRGWWGDILAADLNDQYGSRFWTIRRETLTQEVADRASDILNECLKWFVDDGRLTSAEVTVEISEPSALHILVQAVEPEGESYSFEYTLPWSE